MVFVTASTTSFALASVAHLNQTPYIFVIHGHRDPDSPPSLQCCAHMQGNRIHVSSRYHGGYEAQTHLLRPCVLRALLALCRCCRALIFARSTAWTWACISHSHASKSDDRDRIWARPDARQGDLKGSDVRTTLGRIKLAYTPRRRDYMCPYGSGTYGALLVQSLSRA